MAGLCYIGPSPVMDKEHALWWAWVFGFGALLVIGVPSSFMTRRSWPHYVVAAGALLLLVGQTRSAIAVLDVKPPFHNTPLAVVIVVSILVLELFGLLSALARLLGLVT